MKGLLDAMGAQAVEIIKEWAMRHDNAPGKILTGPLTHPATGKRNGKTPQVQDSLRHDRIIIVPEVPDLIKLLISLGAEPIEGTVAKTGYTNRHYRQFVLPEKIRISNERYSRDGEFVLNETGDHVHGWRPGTLHAPDNTLLAVVNELSNNLTCVIGKTWRQTVDLLRDNAEFPTLPDEAIYALGEFNPFPLGSVWEKVLNGVEQIGQIPYSLMVRNEFINSIQKIHDEWVKSAAEMYGEKSQEFKDAYNRWLDEMLEKFIGEFNEPLADLDGKRAGVFIHYIQAATLEAQTGDLAAADSTGLSARTVND